MANEKWVESPVVSASMTAEWSIEIQGARLSIFQRKNAPDNWFMHVGETFWWCPARMLEAKRVEDARIEALSSFCTLLDAMVHHARVALRLERAAADVSPGHRVCEACEGTGDVGKNAQERVWNKCPECDGSCELPLEAGEASGPTGEPQ
ncbi:MAG: hypothetical protein ACHREM_00100 [Polyangiales bacterium]